jgi:hypothetical protein
MCVRFFKVPGAVECALKNLKLIFVLNTFKKFILTINRGEYYDAKYESQR